MKNYAIIFLGILILSSIMYANSVEDKPTAFLSDFLYNIERAKGTLGSMFGNIQAAEGTIVRFLNRPSGLTSRSHIGDGLYLCAHHSLDELNSLERKIRAERSYLDTYVANGGHIRPSYRDYVRQVRDDFQLRLDGFIQIVNQYCEQQAIILEYGNDPQKYWPALHLRDSLRNRIRWQSNLEVAFDSQTQFWDKSLKAASTGDLHTADVEHTCIPGNSDYARTCISRPEPGLEDPVEKSRDSEVESALDDLENHPYMGWGNGADRSAFEKDRLMSTETRNRYRESNEFWLTGHRRADLSQETGSHAIPQTESRTERQQVNQSRPAPYPPTGNAFIDGLGQDELADIYNRFDRFRAFRVTETNGSVLDDLDNVAGHGFGTSRDREALDRERRASGDLNFERLSDHEIQEFRRFLSRIYDGQTGRPLWLPPPNHPHPSISPSSSMSRPAGPVGHTLSEALIRPLSIPQSSETEFPGQSRRRRIESEFNNLRMRIDPGFFQESTGNSGTLTPEEFRHFRIETEFGNIRLRVNTDYLLENLGGQTPPPAQSDREPDAMPLPVEIRF